MLFSGHLHTFEFDRGGFSRDMQKTLAHACEEGLREFVYAVERRVPVRTGEARGSLGPLADYLGITLDLSGVKVTNEKNHNPEAGAAQTTFGVPEFTIAPFSFSVRIHIGTPHYQFLESNASDTQPDAPWRSFEEGKRVMENFIKTYIRDNLPKVRDYFRRFPIKIGGR